MNIKEMKAVQKELLKQADQIVEEAIKESKVPRMNSNNTERLKIEVYKNLFTVFRDEHKTIVTEIEGEAEISKST